MADTYKCGNGHTWKRGTGVVKETNGIKAEHCRTCGRAGFVEVPRRS